MSSIDLPHGKKRGAARDGADVAVDPRWPLLNRWSKPISSTTTPPPAMVCPPAVSPPLAMMPPRVSPSAMVCPPVVSPPPAQPGLAPSEFPDLVANLNSEGPVSEEPPCSTVVPSSQILGESPTLPTMKDAEGVGSLLPHGSLSSNAKMVPGLLN